MNAQATAGAYSLRERFRALRNLPPFLAIVWQASRSMTLAEAALRLVRALLPVAMLYVGKLIIDEVVMLSRTLDAGDTVRHWLESGALDTLIRLLLAEFALALTSEVMGRVVA